MTSFLLLSQLLLGIPLVPASLNDRVCSHAEVGRQHHLRDSLDVAVISRGEGAQNNVPDADVPCVLQAIGLLSDDSRKQQHTGQNQLQQHVLELMADFGACTLGYDESDPDQCMPTQNLLFDGRCLHQVDVSELLQGTGLLAADEL